MKILMVLGGTSGPTAPLLAVADALEKQAPSTKFYFLSDNKDGTGERLLLHRKVAGFYQIPAGKWRRYFSLMNFFDLFKIFFGFVKSLLILQKLQPDLVFGAGSYVQVPVAFAAYFLKIPVVIHQQDFVLLRSTRLVAPIARAVTVSFSYSGKGIPESTGLFAKDHKSKIHVTGNPVRPSVLRGSTKRAVEKFGLEESLPTVLIMGGGGGSEKLNQTIIEALPELLKYVQVIHLTGGKTAANKFSNFSRYHCYDFLDEDLKDAYASAGLVISRGGMSTITELSRLKKAAVLVPLPRSPQEDNVALLAFLKMAVGIPENIFTPRVAVNLVRKILWSAEAQQELQTNIAKLTPPDADKKIAKLILKIHEQNTR